MSTSSQIIKGARGIKLAEYYDLIKVGMACKNLVCIKCIFRDALDDCGLLQEDGTEKTK